jgi:dihydrolipoamide dehydrogenase
MALPSQDSLDVTVIGGGPAGVVAALRAARLGARTALITRDALGGMAAHDGPVPVRTLAHAARLMREARQMSRYGISAGEPVLDYALLLDRVSEVTADVGTHSVLRKELLESNVAIYEHAGAARFIDPHVIGSEHSPRLSSEKIILCTGGEARPLDVPGFELTSTHSDAWRLSATPPSTLVIGAGATGIQVASIFRAFGSDVTVFEAAPRILMTEDEDVSDAISSGLGTAGVQIVADAGTIERFEPCATGVRLIYETEGQGVRSRRQTADGRPRGRPRGLHRGHQCCAGQRAHALHRRQPNRELYRSRVCVRRAHRGLGQSYTRRDRGYTTI